MEYYPVFRQAILLLKVDPYVLLSRPPLPPCDGALDLHISGTPPTFILSQDQTLKNRHKTAPVKRSGAEWCPNPNPITILNDLNWQRNALIFKEQKILLKKLSRLNCILPVSQNQPYVKVGYIGNTSFNL